MTTRTDQILDELRAERERQDAKFPDQHLPSIRPATGDNAHVVTAARHRVLLAAIARQTVDRRARHDELTWCDVLVEELAEAVEPAVDDDTGNLRNELIQVAAVIVRWIEDLDR